MNSKLLSLTGSLLLLLMISCTSTENLPTSKWESLPENSQKVVAAQNSFAFQLFNLINNPEQEQNNPLISPTSIYLDLSMVYNGAGGATREGMQKALQLKGIDTDLLNKTNALLIKNLPEADTHVNIDLANAIWYRQNLEPLPSFLTINKKYYRAEIQGADFGNPQTLTDINHWVKEKTHNKISKILENIEPDDRMFLLNAVYFNGTWTKSFNEKNTQARDFHLIGGTTEKVPFMYQKEKYNYFQNDTLQIAELPYGNGHFSMFVLLPAKNSGVSSLLETLQAPFFSKLHAQMDTSELNLFLPKWETSYMLDNLRPELSQMGMGEAFTNRANFAKMYKEQQAKISQVKHKTYIKVDEKGTEAAAVTSTGIKTTAMPLNPPPTMKVNRPFVYMITEKDSGVILFLGIVNNPGESMK